MFNFDPKREDLHTAGFPVEELQSLDGIQGFCYVVVYFCVGVAGFFRHTITLVFEHMTLICVSV